MKIFNHTGDVIYDIQVEDKSVRYRSVMNDDSLTLYFSLTGTVTVPVGSYVEFEGQRYTLYYPENLKKINSHNFEYVLTLHGTREALKLYKFKDVSSTPYRLKFSLTAKPEDFLKLLVNVLNIHDSGWTAGSCIDATEKTISFNHESCLDALSRFTQEFNTEFEFVNKTIHLRKVEHFKDAPLSLSYGKGNGFRSGVGRQNDGDKQPLGRLYVQGGERNIDYSKYKSKTLLLPKSATLQVDGKTYRTDADGMYITRVGNNNVAEDSYDAGNIYPHRVGTVSEVVEVDAEESFYDIKDDSIPESLNYNDCRIPGEKATIKFETGSLAGREFDIHTDKKGNLTGYIHAERRFKIVPAELDGVIMPGGVFLPKIGDKYAIFNVALPQAYVCDDATKTGASWEMFREAVRYFAENEEAKFVFTGQLDGIWSKSRWLEIGGKIVPGGYVLFSDEQFQPAGIKIRITGVKDYINNPHKPEITLSNAPVSGSFGSTLGKLEADEVVVEQKKQEAIQYSKRQWRDAKETMKLLEQLPLNFDKSISPLTVETMQLLVGDESLQFRFVNNKTNPVRVNHSVVFNKETKTLTASAGILQHLTIGIKVLTNKHKASDYHYWDVEEYVSPALEADKAYYLYAKCAKGGTSGTFLLSETAIEMEAVSGYYHLLLGILNSEVNNDRSFASLYGFSEILPGRITTDKIVSQDGNSYFNLAANAMQLGDALNYKDGQLTLKGVFVQSSGGRKSSIGVYAGQWNSYTEYFKGEIVEYLGSSYICIKDCPAGTYPTNTTYFQPFAKGQKGEKGKDGKDGVAGDWVSYAFKQSETKPSKPQSSTPVPYGWSDAPNGNGKWWMSKSKIDGATGYASTWSDPIQVTGEDGAKGEDGGYTDFKYRKNSSNTNPPSLDKYSRYPYGWNDTPPPILRGEYLWMTQAFISEDMLIGEWSAPVRVSGEKGEKGEDGKDGKDGEKGDQGKMGPAILYRGRWSSGATYYYNDIERDAVMHQGAYYLLHSGSGTNGGTPGISSHWQRFGANFESVFTEWLFAVRGTVQELTVGSLQTNTAGRRIEARNDTFTVFNTNGEARLKIISESVGGVESSSGSGTSATVSSCNASATNNTDNTERTAQVSITGSTGGTITLGSYSVNISTSSYGDNNNVITGQGGEVTVSIEKGELLLFSAYSNRTENFGARTISVSPGTYTIRVKATAYAYNGSASASVSSISVSSNAISDVLTIGTDGLKFVRSTSEKLYFGRDGFFCRVGNFIAMVCDNTYSQFGTSAKFGYTSNTGTNEISNGIHVWKGGGKVIGLQGIGGGSGGQTSVDWSNVTGKPSTFPPSSHSHSWWDISNKPSTFKPSSHSHSWHDISGKPTTFSPSSHSHNWWDINGRPTKLSQFENDIGAGGSGGSSFAYASHFRSHWNGGIQMEDTQQDFFVQVTNTFIDIGTRRTNGWSGLRISDDGDVLIFKYGSEIGSLSSIFGH